MFKNESNAKEKIIRQIKKSAYEYIVILRVAGVKWSDISDLFGVSGTACKRIFRLTKGVYSVDKAIYTEEEMEMARRYISGNLIIPSIDELTEETALKCYEGKNDIGFQYEFKSDWEQMQELFKNIKWIKRSA